MLKHTEIKDLVKLSLQEGETRPVTVKGWVRTKRGNKHVAFIALNDGTCVQSLQVVAELQTEEKPDGFGDELMKKITTGACLCVEGNLVKSMGKGQNVEIQARNIVVYGEANPDTYPLQKKGHSLEFLREIAHLRPRTNTFGCVLRLRHAMAYALHQFYHERGFVYLHTPIITGSDCEGAGEMFRRGNVPSDHARLGQITQNSGRERGFQQGFLREIDQVDRFRPAGRRAGRHGLVEDLHFRADVPGRKLQHAASLGGILDERTGNGLCMDDLRFLNDMYDKSLIDRLEHVQKMQFERITYTTAVDVLKASNAKFEYPVEWGVDLQSEHERFLVEHHYKKPVIITDYPKEIKSFYMKQNEDGKTVRGMDVLFPQIGEIIGGSQREENLDKLLNRIHELGMPEQAYWWYLDTRRFGTAPHSGFGLGFERLLLFITGMTNIRDVIPFPRYPQNAEF